VKSVKGSSLGLIHCYTGDGSGKTRAALGLALRALGHGYEAHIVQFMKGRWRDKEEFGEVKTAGKIEGFFVYRFGAGKLIRGKEEVTDIDREWASNGLDHVKELFQKNGPKLVVLDEINIALYYGLLDVEKVVEVIENKPENVELVLTGENAPSLIRSKADYLVEFRNIKHPYQEGLEARKGIEY
jgi:cob(I)alamin adenosyltransferase